jgi:hypothetical protein
MRRGGMAQTGAAGTRDSLDLVRRLRFSAMATASSYTTAVDDPLPSAGAGAPSPGRECNPDDETGACMLPVLQRAVALREKIIALSEEGMLLGSMSALSSLPALEEDTISAVKLTDC